MTTVKQADGTEQATEIHIFPEELRGLGEGSRMMTPAANGDGNRMTNGNASVSRTTNGGAPQSRMSNGNRRECYGFDAGRSVRGRLTNRGGASQHTGHGNQACDDADRLR